jgi:hypothetical protein
VRRSYPFFSFLFYFFFILALALEEEQSLYTLLSLFCTLVLILPFIPLFTLPTMRESRGGVLKPNVARSRDITPFVYIYAIR